MAATRPVSDVPRRTRGRRRPAPQSHGAVLEAVRELLKVRRLDELTVAEIVERAGISRPTFYASFDTKYAVVATLIAGVGEGIYDIWQPFFSGEGPIDEAAVREPTIATVERWRRQGALFTATVEGWHSDPEIHEVWNEILQRFEREVLARLHRSRAPRAGDDMLAAAMVSMFERCLYLAVSDPDGPFGSSDEQLADTLSAVWARSLGG
ncbi:TetR/AcrR family transcriptional regulator [Patulibacter minatonensis]|uniref:TetR/AcrR family transcriptional regulator n=1 Tax=Patulibacter minatonensis TaxID=298163 RepID=UPI0004788EDD|nr:TetR/AcrR family transcriptional regulator [Patulibacter minatonensis]